MFYEERGWGLEEVEELREEGLLRGEELVRRDKAKQRKERWEKIGNSNFNRWYGKVKGEGIPEYLKNWEEKRWQRVAKYRLGGGMRGGRYWENEEGRSCRLCGWGDETWEHVWEECVDWGVEESWQEVVEKILGDKGEGEFWMERLDSLRGERGREEMEEEDMGKRGGKLSVRDECEMSCRGIRAAETEVLVRMGEWMDRSMDGVNGISLSRLRYSCHEEKIFCFLFR